MKVADFSRLEAGIRPVLASVEGLVAAELSSFRLVGARVHREREREREGEASWP